MMTRDRSRCALLVLLVLLVATTIVRADGVSDDKLIEKPELALFPLPIPPGDKGDQLKAEIRKLLEPEKLNGYYQRLKEGPAPFLAPLNLNFTALQLQDGGPAVLAVDYDWQTTLQQNTVGASGGSLTHLKGTIKAKGTAAAQPDMNPRNLIESSFNVHLQRSTGGVLQTRTPAEQRAYIADVINPLIEDLSELSTDSLLASPKLAAFLNAISSQMSTQWFWDLSAHAGLEADQRFERKQWVYGLQLGLAMRVWNRQSMAVKWNLADWPLALVRRLTGASTSFEPVGSAFPSIIVGIDQVDPDEAEAELRGEHGTYGRWKVELLYKSPLANMDGEDIFLEMGWRYFKEIAAADGIRNAGMDEYSYFVATLATPSGVYASFSDGKLPMNQSEDQVYELGFKAKFR
ncbi:hypothetical protein ACFL6M_06925 [Candidatus Eisenbacteria bacterium]|uniref:Uncharacterized protein n=1 Tax=Eiseniibacteriota bacterium TaxID=2212470 RepID=A0ABV6YMD3_UNCEI